MSQYGGGGYATAPKSGGGILGFMEKIAPFVPIVGGIASNILGGINERKARLYNSPANQVARLNQAGLPKAAASNLSIGGGAVATSSLGTEQFNQNLSSSISRQIDRKRLEVMQQELREKQSSADIAEGNAKNQLNPAGQFENTNQGTNAMQTIQAQEEAIKAAHMVNKWMPIEKFNNVLKQSKEIEQIAQQTKNHIQQHGILLSESKIKNTIANYQDSMSMAELENIISRTTGIIKENKLRDIAISIEYETMLSKIKLAKNAALISDQSLEAAKLSNILTNLSLPSTRAYYTIRRNFDNAAMAKPNLPNTLLYLGMFQPNTSNYGLSNIGAGIDPLLRRYNDLTNGMR